MNNTAAQNKLLKLCLLERLGRELDVFKKALASVADPISKLLRAHLFTEQVLEAHIRSWLPKPESLLKQNLRYIVKLELVAAHGILEDRISQSLRALNAVRNKCAHKIDYELSERDVDSIGQPLGEQFQSFKAAHPGDPEAQLGRLLPLLATLLIVQLRGPYDSITSDKNKN